jgi:hypothetical protein
MSGELKIRTTVKFSQGKSMDRRCFRGWRGDCVWSLIVAFDGVSGHWTSAVRVRAGEDS